ncbi:MAG: helix-turn-helix transcriptional regulator [Hyphomicrobiales bacterium]|nr:helix-turn-helix transcriptional regulator [Hyphomicrobiales bacterium]
MRIRIRELRKARDMTLKELADKIGTTPQTVQRLETANMTLSIAWLEKIAAALNVEPADLIGRSGGKQIPILGGIGAQGYMTRASDAETFQFDVPAEDPVAARFDVSFNGYATGSIIIANKLREADALNAHGVDCIVALPSGKTMFRWVIRGRGETWTLIPPDRKTDVQYDQQIAWLARVVLAITYY